MALDLAAPHPDESIVDQQDKRRAAVAWYRFFLLIASTLNSLSRSLTSTISDLGAVDVLTTRGDILTRDASANARLPIGAAGTLLSSNGTDASWQSPASANIALQLLTSGDASGATLDLDLSSYTGYRGIIVELYAFLPDTDGVNLTCQFSTDGGANWLSSAYHHSAGATYEGGGYIASTGSASDSKIILNDTTAGALIGSAAGEGIDVTLKIMGWQLTVAKPRIIWDGAYWSNSGTAGLARLFGSGSHATAQDMTALRFAFSSGNIASGKYAVYGLT